MKKILMIIMLLLLTGCSSEYVIEIKDGKIKEKINIVQPVITDKCENSKSECDDDTGEFVTFDYSPFIVVDKSEYKVTNTTNKDEIVSIREYEFDYKNYADSTALNMCTGYFNYKQNIFKIVIEANDFSKCYQSDTIKLIIKTDNIVYKNNADIKENDTYTWIIDKDNASEKEIQFIVQPFSIKKVLTWIAVLCIIGIMIAMIIKKSKKVNEIN